MAVLRMKLDGEKYELDLDKITLGEAHILKREYGMEDFTTFNYFDPEQMIGVFVIAVRRVHPELSEEEVRAKVEALENGPIFADINKQVQDAVEKRKPTIEKLKKVVPPPAAGATPVPASGKRATRRKAPGPRKSGGSTA